MYNGQIDTISNRADWTGPFVQLVDDTGAIINILNVGIGFDCSVYIKGMRQSHHNSWQLVLGSISNGKVIASAGDDGPGFQWSFLEADLSNLCAGTYEFGVKTTTNGEVNDLIIGTVTVLEGN
jgi:hypothetical protein